VAAADAAEVLSILTAEGETASLIGSLEAHAGEGPQVEVNHTDKWGWAT